ncbi:MAG: hypothetical protein KAI84_05735, partial [Gammaproteobacteria bacterium]|nr:hypothetical protein [Gammaproteobacteria bacterium]
RVKRRPDPPFFLMSAKYFADFSGPDKSFLQVIAIAAKFFPESEQTIGSLSPQLLYRADRAVSICDLFITM